MENSEFAINGSIATWNMPRVEGSTGGTYTGTFTFRCFLSPTQIMQAGRQLREYLGAHANLASETEFNLAYALSRLSQKIISAPPFWTSTTQDGSPAGNIGDINVIQVVLEASERAEALFQEKIQKEREAILERSIQQAEKLLQNPENR